MDRISRERCIKSKLAEKQLIEPRNLANLTHGPFSSNIEMPTHTMHGIPIETILPMVLYCHLPFNHHDTFEIFGLAIRKQYKYVSHYVCFCTLYNSTILLVII